MTKIRFFGVKRGNVSLLLVLGLILILVFLFVLYMGSSSGSLKFGLFSQKKVEQEIAAAPRTTTPSTISLDQSDPHLGDTVTFSYTAQNAKNLRITVACYQGGIGDMVWSADQATGTSFLLGGTSSLWLTKDGAADCYVWLYRQSLSKGFLASTLFTALGKR